MWNVVIYDMENFWHDKAKLTIIKQVEKEPDTKRILDIDGKLFRWCAVSRKEKLFAVEEITLSESPVEQISYDFTCPYCEKIHHDAWEYEDEKEEMECIYCDSLITFYRTFDDEDSDDTWISYNVQPVKQNSILSI